MQLKQCMLAASQIPCLETEVDYPCFIQAKLDGIRCIAINGQAYSRKMKLIPNRFIQKVFAELNLHGFDGELMVHGDFNQVQSAVMSEDGEPDFYYVVYDKWDSTGDYNERFAILNDWFMYNQNKYLELITNDLVFSPTCVEGMLQVHIDDGYEGAILRSPSGLYKQGRSTIKEGYLLKLKRFSDDEAEIIGFEEKLTNTNVKEVDERGYSKRSSKKDGMVPANTLGALVVRWNGIEFNIGSGFDDATRKYIWDNRELLIGKLVTFKYQELSKYGVPRFPTYKWLRQEYDE